MVVISDILDDSNGGYPNKKQEKQKEEENLNKKRMRAQEKVVCSYSLPIPEDLTLTCFALVRICDYPSLSLVATNFRNHIASSKLYEERTNLGLTENVLYAYIGFPPFESPSWYILQRKPYRNLPNKISSRLCRIDSLPPMPWGSAVVTIGTKLYVLGGCIGDARTSNVTLIDCKSHKHYSVTSMKVARCRAAAGVIDGKIYVIGGCEMRSSNWAEVYDVKKQTWNHVPGDPYPNVFGRGEFVTYAVMKEKIFFLDMFRNSFTYEPKEGKWGEIFNVLWNESSCVIDHMLFSINPVVHFSGNQIIIYDPEKKSSSPLKGLQGFPRNIILQPDYRSEEVLLPEDPEPSVRYHIGRAFYEETKLVNFGGKLLILGPDMRWFSKYNGKREIWCVEIAWERKNGEYWGEVESVQVVLTPTKPASVELCPTATI